MASQSSQRRSWLRVAGQWAQNPLEEPVSAPEVQPETLPPPPLSPTLVVPPPTSFSFEDITIPPPELPSTPPASTQATDVPVIQEVVPATVPPRKQSRVMTSGDADPSVGPGPRSLIPGGVTTGWIYSPSLGMHANFKFNGVTFCIHSSSPPFRFIYFFISPWSAWCASKRFHLRVPRRPCC